MNMLIATVAVPREAAFASGTAANAIFIVYFAAAGFLLLTAAGVIMRHAERSERSEAVRERLFERKR